MLNIVDLITQASLLVQIVMALLLLASLLSWVIIFRMSARLGTARNFDQQFETWFWSGEDLAKLYQGIQGSPERQGLEQIFYVGFSEYLRMHKKRQPKDDIIDGVERKLRVGLGRQQLLLESGLTTLASIGSVAPYVGLFGTVWGIMNAFLGLSQTEQATLATVAPGIAEALIATAMGLFAAIPAVLAYNHFTAKSARLYESRALFCDEMTGMLQRENRTENQTNIPRTTQVSQSNSTLKDDILEKNETTTVTITGAVGTDTILDNDTAATLTINDNSVIEAAGTTVRGTFDVTDFQSVASLTINEKSVTTATPTNPVIITTSLGKLVITDYNQSTGELNYEYTENGKAEDNSNSDIFAQFNLVLTNTIGDTISDTLDIKIIDAALTTNDKNTISEKTDTVSGNMLTQSGADDAISTTITAVESSNGNAGAIDSGKQVNQSKPL